MKKEIVCSKVARTGGIKIEGSEEWYNPTPQCAPYVKKEMEGCKLELDMVEGTQKPTFAFVKNLGKAQVLAAPSITPQGQKTLDLAFRKDEMIVRQNVLARAVEMYIAGKITKEEIITTAETFEKWVQTGKLMAQQIVNIQNIE